jgi:hypothetical protein
LSNHAADRAPLPPLARQVHKSEGLFNKIDFLIDKINFELYTSNRVV